MLPLHSPALAIPVCIYDGSDNRLCLEENISRWLNDFIANDPDEWYLCGDALFLNAIEGNFHSMSKDGKHGYEIWHGLLKYEWWN